MTRSSKLWPLSLSAALVVALSVSIVSAAPWSGPTQAPPAGNTPTPINVGSDSQYKAGGFQASVIASDNIIMGTQYCFQGPLNCITSWLDAGPWMFAGTAIHYSTGRVGIGTTTPGTLFSVQGVANLHTATSTFYSTGGINITRGCFSINGVCIGGSGSQWTTSGNNIYNNNSGNVGINTPTPTANLSVNGTNNVNPLYPDGLVGTPIIQHLGMNGSYTVPAGKTLYITSLSTGFGGMRIITGSSAATFSSTQGAPIIVGAGSTLTVSGSGGSSADISGILVNSGVTPIIQHLGMNGSYTVPAGKTLYITSLSTGFGGMRIITGSSAATFSSTQGAPIIVGAGSTLTVSGSGGSSADISGYLTNASGLGGP